MDLNRTQWRKSSKSGNNGGECVEVASGSHRVVAVRDSKNPDGPKLAFAPEMWRAFTSHVKTGRTD